MRWPGCGSPETSSTRSRSRTPFTVNTARLLRSVSSPSTGGTDSSTTLAPPWVMGISTRTGRPTTAGRARGASPSIDSATCVAPPGVALPSGSTRTMAVTVLPTKPKAGAVSTARR